MKKQEKKKEKTQEIKDFFLQAYIEFHITEITDKILD